MLSQTHVHRRAVNKLDRLTAHIRCLRIIVQRGLDIGVTHQLHECGQAHAGADHVGSKGVSKAMRIGERDAGGLAMVAK